MLSWWHGVDLDRLLDCARLLPGLVGHEVPGQVAKAGRIQDRHPEPEWLAGVRAKALGRAYPALFANTAREQCGLNRNPCGRRSGTDRSWPVRGDTAPILADGYPVRPPPGILPLQAGMAAGQVSPDYSRILRE